jgi:G:T/U-mismatch repair DNA glycosylase
MVTSRDEIASFIPEKRPKLVILGTMAAISARSVDGCRPETPFFYANNRNHFWRILQLVFDENRKPQQLSVSEKQSLLNFRQIAMANLVQEIEVEPVEAHNPSDAVLIKAMRKNRLRFKAVSSDFKEILKSTAVFFTCRENKGIQNLVDGYLEFNNLDTVLREKIIYLPSPTRCNPQSRSLIWKEKMRKASSR